MTLNPIPADKPYAALVNREYNANEGLSFAGCYNQARQGRAGDPLAGKNTPGTDIPWDDATEVQGLISVAYSELGLDKSTLEAEMKANPGPSEFQNLSYAGWGLVPGQPADPSLVIKSVIDTTTGAVISRAIVIP